MLEKVVAIIQEQLNLDGVDITESSSFKVPEPSDGNGGKRKKDRERDETQLYL